MKRTLERYKEVTSPSALNIDNMCILRGKPITDDFSPYYKIDKKTGDTHLSLLLSVRNRREKRAIPVCVIVNGHIPTNEDLRYLEGGMAEQMLKRLSSKCDITLYCHAVFDTVKKRQYLICDTYRTESRTSRMQAIQEETAKKNKMYSKYTSPYSFGTKDKQNLRGKSKVGEVAETKTKQK